MENSIILAIIFALIAIGFFILNRLYRNRTTAATEEHHDHGNDGVCCGKHTNCEKGYDNSNLYFDDEELDRFKEKKAEEYTDAEAEEFRQILYTMKEDEIDTWVHCLQTRGIELPIEVKDEILLILQ